MWMSKLWKFLMGSHMVIFTAKSFSSSLQSKIGFQRFSKWACRNEEQWRLHKALAKVLSYVYSPREIGHQSVLQWSVHMRGRKQEWLYTQVVRQTHTNWIKAGKPTSGWHIHYISIRKLRYMTTLICRPDTEHSLPGIAMGTHDACSASQRPTTNISPKNISRHISPLIPLPVPPVLYWIYTLHKMEMAWHK